MGVIFDAQLSFNTHFKNITKLAFYCLRSTAHIRPFLSMPDAERLIHAFIRSRLDYCNSLFAGLPANLIERLQHIHNSAVCVLTYTLPLYFFNWLPVQSCIDFKVLVLTFKVVHGLATEYICNLVTPSTPARFLHSADSLQPRYIERVTP